MNMLRRRYGLRWPGHWIPLHVWLDAAYILLICALVLAIYGWAGARDEADQQLTKLEKAERIATHCMNGGKFIADTHGALQCGVALLEEAERYVK